LEEQKLPVKRYTNGALLYALDSNFKALESSNNSSNLLNKRKTFLTALHAETVPSLSDSMFAKNLQNIGSKQFAELFEWLDLKQRPFPEELLTKRGLLDVVVEKRRSVSHGREAPSVVGVQVGGIDEINVALEAIISYVEYFFNCIEIHITNNDFVDATPATPVLGLA